MIMQLHILVCRPLMYRRRWRAYVKRVVFSQEHGRCAAREAVWTSDARRSLLGCDVEGRFEVFAVPAPLQRQAGDLRPGAYGRSLVLTSAAPRQKTEIGNHKTQYKTRTCLEGPRWAKWEVWKKRHVVLTSLEVRRNTCPTYPCCVSCLPHKTKMHKEQNVIRDHRMNKRHPGLAWLRQEHTCRSASCADSYQRSYCLTFAFGKSQRTSSMEGLVQKDREFCLQ